MATNNKRNLIEGTMHYKCIMFLLLAVLIAFGIYSLAVMPKNEFPSFTVRQGVVAGVYPGATAEEVEAQLTKPLETFLWSFKEIKKEKTYSRTRDGICYVFVELNDNVSDKDEFWSKFKLRLQQFKSSLPQGVLALIANDDFGDASAMLITMQSDQKTYRELHDYMTTLQDRLRTIPELGNLRVTGEQQEQISVYVDRDRLSDYGINAATLLSTLSSQGMTLVSGSVDDQLTVRPLHLQSTLSSEWEVGQQIVYSDPLGNVVRLSDIATIVREYPSSDTYVTNNGHKCIVLSIEMREGYNIVDFGNKVKAVLTDFEQTLPQDVTIYPITDQSHVVNASVMDFLKELLISIIAVIIVIMLLLPLRVSSVAACTIPITIFISLGIFYAAGIELNTVTLAALIVSLGMIVDNSIVIIDCYLEKIGEGMSRWHAASDAAKEFLPSIFSATLAISITFFPLLFTLKGTFRDFIVWFPLGISIVLGVSLLVAVLVVPWMQYAFIRKGLNTQRTGDDGKKRRRTFLDIVQGAYDRLITACFAHPFIVLTVGGASILLGAWLFSKVPQQLMPRAERNQFAVEIYLPTGTAIERTAQVADSLRDMMSHDKRVANITTFYGSGSPRFQASYAPQIGGTNFAQFIVNTTGNEATEQLVVEFTRKYSDYFADAMVRIKQLDYNAANSPIEIRFSGNNLADLYQAVDTAMQLMRQDPNLLLVRSTFEGTQDGISVALNSDEATRLGISKTMLSINLATRFGSGLPLTNLWEGDRSVPVVLKDSHAQLQTAADVENATVSGVLPGVSVPLRQVADVNPDWHYGQIVRFNGVRTLSVYADAQPGVNLNVATDGAIARLQPLKQRLAEQGITMTIGGQRLEDNTSGPQIYSGLAIAIGIILLILLFHLRDLRLTMLIMVSLLFSLLGAALGLLIMNQPASLTGILGIISLMGIIVRNGIIMVDYAEELRVKHRLSAKHAALHAAKRRMRPIFLTSAAASMGVIPMVIANSPMWGPMGVVVCFGTMVAMLFIITMIPIGYWMIFRLEDKHRILKNEKERSQQFHLKHKQRHAKNQA